MVPFAHSRTPVAAGCVDAHLRSFSPPRFPSSPPATTIEPPAAYEISLAGIRSIVDLVRGSSDSLPGYAALYFNRPSK